MNAFHMQCLNCYCYDAVEMLSETTRTCRGVNVKWFYLLLYSMATKNYFALTHQYFLLYGVTNNMCLHWFVPGAFCSTLQRNEINGRKWHCANSLGANCHFSP